MTKSSVLLAGIDPTQIPLPVGTKVTARVALCDGDTTVPLGAVGQVVATEGERVLVRLASGRSVRYLRADVVPTKLGQARYAVRRELAWQALEPCVVIRTVVGSRAWGLADEGSDTDRRGVFVLPFSWTTALVEAPTELISLDGSDTYWEVDKAIRQAMRADPNTLETLFLPHAEATDDMGAWLLEARDAFVSQDVYGSFGRYALSQLGRLRQSLRLAQHRSELIAWLRADPDLSLDRAAERLAQHASVEGPTEKDQVQRAKGYIKQLYASLYDQGRIAARDFKTLAAFAQREELPDELPRQLRPKNAYNLIRLIATATRWLEGGSPTFVFEGELRDQLLTIKRGEMSLDEVVALAEGMMPALDRARASSPLPPRPDVTTIDRTLRRIRAEAARRHFETRAAPFGAEGPEMPPAAEVTS